MIHFNDIPTENTLDIRVSLALDNATKATIDSDSSTVVDTAFNQIILINPPNPPRVLPQATPGNFEAHPGSIAFIESAQAGGVNLVFGPPNEPSTVVNFR